jgi:O-antigen/teichoic acid export membrane protein
MTRLFGYILATISGGAFLIATLGLFFQLFVINEDDKDSDYSQTLSILCLVIVSAFIVFYYVYQTGFGKTKLEKVREELEILKIKKEMDNLKVS